MEHNFNPNKGDLKYIIQEEQNKKNEMQSSAFLVNKKTRSKKTFLNFLITIFSKLRK